MIETCEKLCRYVRRNLGKPSAIVSMNVHEEHGFVRFRWYERDFVVKRTLEVFEVKEHNLLVTAASMLMQVILKTAETEGNVVEGIVNSILQAEDLIADERQRDSGFKLLASVKATLRRLARPSGESHPPSTNSLLESTTPDKLHAHPATLKQPASRGFGPNLPFEEIHQVQA